jgi:hypothetical protein
MQSNTISAPTSSTDSPSASITSSATTDLPKKAQALNAIFQASSGLVNFCGASGMNYLLSQNSDGSKKIYDDVNSLTLAYMPQNQHSTQTDNDNAILLTKLGLICVSTFFIQPNYAVEGKFNYSEATSNIADHFFSYLTPNSALCTNAGPANTEEAVNAEISKIKQLFTDTLSCVFQHSTPCPTGTYSDPSPLNSYVAPAAAIAAIAAISSLIVNETNILGGIDSNASIPLGYGSSQSQTVQEAISEFAYPHVVLININKSFRVTNDVLNYLIANDLEILDDAGIISFTNLTSDTYDHLTPIFDTVTSSTDLMGNFYDSLTATLSSCTGA